jgi:alpha-tubulin suppressor-like RCC1 family protein
MTPWPRGFLADHVARYTLRDHRMIPPGRLLVLLATARAGVGCGADAPYPCAESRQCRNGSVQGTCEATGFCSFPDPACDSGRRYGRLSEASLADQCVADGPPCATQVVTGVAFSCALRGDGQTRCWGFNDDGQLGNGGLATSVAPVAVGAAGSPLAGVLALAAGDDHGCARREDGVYCWGDANDGQLGQTLTMAEQPTPVPVLQGGATWPAPLAVVAGNNYTCALTAAHEVWCWGSNPEGALGATDAALRSSDPLLVRSDASTVVSGSVHVCVIDDGGTAVCWGGNSDGQLGDATPREAFHPAPVTLRASVSLVAAGVGTTCVAAGDAVECFGRLRGSVAVPDLQALAAGAAHACALDGAGQVLCWGQNLHGQLGAAGSDRAAAAPVPGLVDVVDLATHGNHTCAVDRQGTVWCWGANACGQLGHGSASTCGTTHDGTGDSTPEPTAVPVCE